MIVKDKHLTTIWYDNSSDKIKIIDQRLLPHEIKFVELNTLEDACFAIQDMQVRGAPLIGVTAAYGLCLTANENSKIEFLEKACIHLKKARPTAVNLNWSLERMMAKAYETDENDMVDVLYDEAKNILDEDINFCKQIGIHGSQLIEKLSKNKKKIVNILTHCNAGWLATVDWGTATSPIYTAFNNNIPIHVWVDETRPRNQGSFLTSWELREHGVPHTIIPDNTGGHLMQKGDVDIVIVGSDRTTFTGDVCNKIGTYLKALSAYDNNIPFYAALPSSTIDWTINNGMEIPIEERNNNEVSKIRGKNKNGLMEEVQIIPDNTNVINYAFDVTPRKLVTGIITERGVCGASKNEVLKLIPEKAHCQ